MKKKNKIKIIIIIILLILIYISNLHYPLRSYIAMYPLKIYYKNTGLFDDINLKIPSGKIEKENFYPFMLYFNSDKGFSNYIGKDANLSIAYNFGGFKFRNKNSSYYDKDSDLYSSFYGAYIIDSDDDNSFGFNENGHIDVDLLAKVPEYDQKYLVLSSIGLSSKNSVFENDIIDMKENIKYIDIDDWIKIDSNITTNSPIHENTNFYRGYIQFGIPKSEANKNFPLINIYGRMYVKYFKEYDRTIGFYILGKNKNIVDKIDKEIVSKSKIERMD